jgi:hypothetical protein
MNVKFAMLNRHLRCRPTQGKYDRRGATSDIIFRSKVPYFQWAMVFIHCNCRLIWCSNRSRDAGRTSVVSGDLKHVSLAFQIFQLSFTVLELSLLSVYDGYYLFPVFQCVARRRSYFVCARCPQTRIFSIWNISVTIYRFGVNATSGLWRLLSFSVVPIRRATSVRLPLCRATSKIQA